MKKLLSIITAFSVGLTTSFTAMNVISCSNELSAQNKSDKNDVNVFDFQLEKGNVLSVVIYGDSVNNFAYDSSQDQDAADGKASTKITIGDYSVSNHIKGNRPTLKSIFDEYDLRNLSPGKNFSYVKEKIISIIIKKVPAVKKSDICVYFDTNNLYPTYEETSIKFDNDKDYSAMIRFLKYKEDSEETQAVVLKVDKMIYKWIDNFKINSSLKDFIKQNIISIQYEYDSVGFNNRFYITVSLKNTREILYLFNTIYLSYDGNVYEKTTQ